MEEVRIGAGQCGDLCWLVYGFATRSFTTLVIAGTLSVQSTFLNVEGVSSADGFDSSFSFEENSNLAIHSFCERPILNLASVLGQLC
jgi:hypothetical protein